MNDFERYLQQNTGIPLTAASNFLLELKSFPERTASLNKTAGWDDPPDETGSLEGQFEVAVEQAVQIMGDVAQKLLRIMNASLIYANSARGDYAKDVKCALHHNEWDHKASFEWLVERMTVMAGAPHIAEPDAAPASTQPIEICKRMIRAEQELLQAWQALCAIVGDNAMRGRIKREMASSQEHLDGLWMCIPEDVRKGAVPPLEIPPEAAAAAAEPPPPDPAAEPEAPPAAPAEPEKTAAGKWQENLDFLPGGGIGVVHRPGTTTEELIASIQGAGALEGALEREAGKTISTPTAYGLGGGTLGALAGGALGYGLTGDPRLGLAGAAAGGGLGYGVGRHVGSGQRKKSLDAAGQEAYDEYLAGVGEQKTSSIKEAASRMVKFAKKDDDEDEDPHEKVRDLEQKGRESAVSGASRAQHMSRHQRGERFGDTMGRVLGTLAGAGAGAGMSPSSKALAGVGGGALGYLVGGKVGKEIGKEKDIKREKYASVISAVASRMVERVKTAEDALMEAAPAEAPMASPTDNPESMPANYLQAEAIGQQLQNQNEVGFYKQRAREAESAAAAVTQQAEQQSMAMQEESSMLQMQADEADSKVRNALQQAVEARDEALNSTEVAANLRMGLQQQRQQMMELASQDPTQVAAEALGLGLQPPPQPPMEAGGMAAAMGVPPGMEGMPPEGAPPGAVPDAGMPPPPAPGGPAGQAPPPGGGAPPGSPPPGGQGPAAPAGGPPGPAPPEMAAPAAPAVPKQASVEKTAAQPGRAGLIGAGIGAGLGAGAGLLSAYREASPFRHERLQDRLTDLQQTQDGSYSQAAQVAKMKKQMAESELTQQFPGHMAARRTAGTALSGALKGGAIGAGIGTLSR